MILKANKKFIDASCVVHLLAVGEKYADNLIFSVDRLYHGKDLSGCLFVIRGINSAGNLVMGTLSQEINDDSLLLTWDISPAFTAVSGILALEIVCYDDENMILKYAVSPLQVRESILEGYNGGIDGIEEVLKEMEQILDKTRSISVKLPIIKNDTWWLYNVESGEYEDTQQSVFGEDGKDGLSAYEIALQNGYVGSLEEWLLSLKGKDGFSPKVSIEKTDHGYNVSVTDQTHTETITTYGSDDLYTREQIDNKLFFKADKSDVASNTEAIEKLNGDGDGSVNKKITDKVAEIVADAPEDFDTLKEMSDWIHEHEGSAAAMNTAIQANTTAIQNHAVDISKKADVDDLSDVAISGNYTDLKNTPESLPASDVFEWAKSIEKPTYTASEVGADPLGHADAVVELHNLSDSAHKDMRNSINSKANSSDLENHTSDIDNPHNVTKEQINLGNVGNFKAVSVEGNQELSDTEKKNARNNIGAGTSSFSGVATDLSGTLAIGKGGTGKTTAKAAQNALLGDMNELTTEVPDTQRIVVRYADPNDTDGAVACKNISYFWNYIWGKLRTNTINILTNELDADGVIDLGVNGEIYYLNGLYIRIDINKVYTSVDLNSWSLKATLPTECTQLAYGNGYYVTCAYAAVDSAYPIYRSSDLITWAKVYDYTARIQKLVYSGYNFQAHFSDGVLLKSSNGSSWSTDYIYGTTPLISFSVCKGLCFQNTSSSKSTSVYANAYVMTANADIYDLAYGNGMFIAVDLNGCLLFSSDGITWHKYKSLYASNTKLRVCYGNGVFIITVDNYGASDPRAIVDFGNGSSISISGGVLPNVIFDGYRFVFSESIMSHEATPRAATAKVLNFKTIQVPFEHALKLLSVKS